MKRAIPVFGLLIALAACGAPKDPLDELAVGERGRVARVLDGDALVFDTGQSVRLVGIEAPAAPYRDRYDRALAHVVTVDALGPRLWLNAEMVK